MGRFMDFLENEYGEDKLIEMVDKENQRSNENE